MTARKPKDQHLPMGRPPLFNQALADRVCERLLNGEPLARICADPDMPNYSTVWRWENENPDFRQQSARARINGTNYMADDCIRLADDQTIDPAHKRVMVDTRLRLIGKWNRQVYGERTELTGANGGAIQVEQVKTYKIDVANLPAEDREAFKLAMIEAKARLEVKANESE